MIVEIIVMKLVDVSFELSIEIFHHFSLSVFSWW
jgi:hypothetical protein